MKKLLPLVLVTTLVAGCSMNSIQNGLSAMQNIPGVSDLLHHHFVLKSYDGKTIKTGKMTPHIEFGENLTVNGSMCNNFHGKGDFTGGVLTVKQLVSTRKMCIDPTLNELDSVINQMLSQGAKVSLSKGSFTLKTAEHTLVYGLKDWVK